LNSIVDRVMMQLMRHGWGFDTRKGMFWIVSVGERWRVLFEDENLGNYETPEQALDDLVTDHCEPCSAGDTSALGLPDSLSEWIRF
jgi:hypothetical protein